MLLRIGLLVVVLRVVLIVVLLIVRGLVVPWILLHKSFAWLLFFNLDHLHLLSLAWLWSVVRLSAVGIVVRLGERCGCHLLLIQLLLIQVGFVLLWDVLVTRVHHLLL